MSDFGDDDGFGEDGDGDEPEGGDDGYEDGGPEGDDGPEGDGGYDDGAPDGEGDPGGGDDEDAPDGPPDAAQGYGDGGAWGEGGGDDGEDDAPGWEPAPEGPATDDVLFGDANDFPAADPEDFVDDRGDWSEGDYAEAAQELFGDDPHFGERAIDRWTDEGYVLAPDAPAYSSYVERVAPGQSESLAFMLHEGRVVPRGFVTTAALLALRAALPYVDFSQVDVTVPRRGGDSPFQPQPLPPELAAVDPRDTVDLRPYCSPVGDQGPTSRCAAFAWTHAVELVRRMLGEPAPELSCSFVMLQFQRRQGDDRDYGWAFEGGEGTSGSWEPGALLAERGTCRAMLWPNDEAVPRASWDQMVAEAPHFRLPARVQPIALDDMKKVLSAGCPVQISMTTGPIFSEVGRDGVVRAAEGASGRHGYHAMLCVGYVGNYFIVKNSWGDDWGDRGYCYVPKMVLAASEPELVAILFQRPTAPGPGPGGAPSTPAAPPTPNAPPAPIPPVAAPRAGVLDPFRAPAPRAPAARRFCEQCGAPLEPPEAAFCFTCGARVPR